MSTTTDKRIIELVINGQAANSSLKELEQTSRSLWSQLRKTTDPTDKKKLADQFKTVNRELISMRTELKTTDSAWQSFLKNTKNTVLGVFGGNLLTGGIRGAIGLFTTLINKNAELSDAFANVRKTTGMTADEIETLYTSLKKIDTRTSRSELLSLASEAGKLGKSSVEDVKKFVEQADKIKVALGEDLGEGAVTDIGKLSNIFKTEMINIASAINEVGAASEASESYQVDFLKRMAGVAPTVKLGADEVLGYGAALEALGQTQEVSATALNSFMIDFVSKTEEFGKITGFAKGELRGLLDEKGTNEAFITFLDKLKEGSSSSEEMINKLKDLGVDGTRGANVLLTLANNTQRVKDQQLIANDAIKDGSSIIREFEIKNNDLAGAWEKLKNKMSDLWENSRVKNWLEKIILPLMDARTAAQKLTDSFKEQEKYSNSLETALNPLLARYDELKNKSKLNKEEQEELRDIIAKIADFVPSAVTQWDSYGRAMDINKDKVVAFSDAQKILAKRLHENAIGSLNSEIVSLEKDIISLQKLLNEGGDWKFLSTKSEKMTFVPYANEEIKALTDRMKEYREQQHAAIIERASLLGEDINKYSGQSKENAENDKKIIGGSIPNKKGDKKNSPVDDLKKLQDEILSLEKEAINKKKSIDEQELVRVNQKYEELLGRAKGHNEEITRINQLWHDEVDAVRLKQDKEETIKLIEEGYEEQYLLLNDKLSQDLITNEEHQIKVEELEYSRLLNLKLMKEAFAEDTSDIDQKLFDQQIKLNDASTKNLKENTKKQVDLLKMRKDAEHDLATAQYDAIQFGAQTMNKYLRDSTTSFLAFLALEKSAAIVQIILNLNKEIASYFAWGAATAGPGGPALAAPNVAAAKMRAGLSIAIVTGQTVDDLVDYFSDGKTYKKGGVVNGASHEEGGIHLIDSKTRKKVGEMEGGEPYMILSGATYDNNKLLIDALLESSMFENGRPVLPDFVRMNNAVGFFERGGIRKNLADSKAESHYKKNINQEIKELQTIIKLFGVGVQDFISILNRIEEDGIQATVSYSQLREMVKGARKTRRLSSGEKRDGLTNNGFVYLEDDIL